MFAFLSLLLLFPPVLAGKEYRKIGAVEIVGSMSFSPTVLKDRLKMSRSDAWVLPDMVEYDIEMNLKGFLKENGFLQSEIQWDLIPLEERDVALNVHITEGPQYRLANLVVKGVKAFAPEDISSQFKLHVGDIANLVEIKDALEEIKGMYADHGFIAWSFLPEMNFDPAKQTVAMTFTFVEGIQFRVGYVGFVGYSDQAEEDRIRAQADIHPGDIYSPSKEKAVLATLKKFGVTKDTVEIVDEKRGLVSIAFWRESP